MKPTFKMYVKPNCPYCTKARDLIVDYLGLRAEIHDVTDRNTLRNELIEETGITTVPIIFLGSELIGGCSDLQEIIREGKMEMLLLKEENYLLKEEILRLRRSF